MYFSLFRIRTEKLGGAWCPGSQISSDSYEWLQIDFRQVKVITAVETQGRYGGGNGLEFPREYKLEYWRAGLGTWIRYKLRTGHQVSVDYHNRIRFML